MLFNFLLEFMFSVIFCVSIVGLAVVLIDMVEDR